MNFGQTKLRSAKSHKRTRTLRPFVCIRGSSHAVIIALVPEPVRLMVVAGEASGDAHAAALVRILRETQSQTTFEFFGAAGPLMRTAGVEAVVATDDLAILGILEVGRALPKFWRAFQQLKRAASERKPDAVILVDWPEFNLKLARALHRQGLKVIYYISPQLWAWRSYRSKQIAKHVDLLLSILPFEKQWYSQRGIGHVEFVGHPLAGEVAARFDRQEFCRRNDLDPTRPIISLLAGSRRKELHRILPPMLDAANLIARERPDVQFVVVVAPSRSVEEIESVIRSRNAAGDLLPIVNNQTREALAASDAAAVASGTATLEAALLGTPMVIVYKESTVNWHVLGSLINVDHYGLVNLIAGERVATELIQRDLTGEKLAGELLQLLEEETNRRMRERLHRIAHELGEGGATQRAAERIVESLRD